MEHSWWYQTGLVRPDLTTREMIHHKLLRQWQHNPVVSKLAADGPNAHGVGIPRVRQPVWEKTSLLRSLLALYHSNDSAVVP